MKKKEIQNIISEGWSVRQLLNAQKREEKNKKTKAWVEREKLGLNKPESRRSIYPSKEHRRT